MKLYVKRMLEEKVELERKINKARIAIAKPPYGMDKQQVLMLAEQVKSMEAYLGCLNKRIDYDNTSHNEE